MTTTSIASGTTTAPPNHSLRTFLVIWFGQVVSLMGTNMTRFAVLAWAYQQTGDATTLALLGFFGFLPLVVVSPFAGVWIDRLDRRKILIVADLGAGLMTVVMLILYTTGELQIWHLYLAEGLTGVFDAFHLPAYYASVSLLVPKAHLSRANALRALGRTLTQIFAPVLAGALLPFITLAGIMLIDTVTFLFAVGALLFVRIPRPTATPQSGEPNAIGESFLAQMRAGWDYIRLRPGLPGLLWIYSGINFAAALTYFGVLPAMVLARTPGDDATKALSLATVQAMLGVGGFFGGLILTATGGPKRQIHGVLAGAGISFLLGDFLFAVGRDTAVWGFAAFSAAAFVPLIIASNRTIWQRKVAPEVQGRVFAIQTMLEQASLPLGYLLAGPLADHVFGPAMMPGGSLAPIFGGLVGTGQGAGMGLMFLCTCLMGTAIALSGYLRPSVRNVERNLADFDEEA